MSGVIIDRLKQSIGKKAKIFLHNGFRYEGKITNCDDKYVEILNLNEHYKVIEISDIKDFDVYGGGE